MQMDDLGGDVHKKLYISVCSLEKLGLELFEDQIWRDDTSDLLGYEH